MKKLALLSLAALLIVSTINIMPAAAEDPSMEGKIVKREGETTLYYIGIDGNRYIFPNEKTYKSWFVDFSDVEEASDEELSKYPLVGNIRYRPGVLLIKIQTDPKVYAVSKNGVLRWIRNERLAKKLYGDFWSQLVEDISAAFFTNYSVGEDIDEDGDFDPDQEINDSETIDDNRGHGRGLGLGLSNRGRRASSARAKIVVCHRDRTIVIGSPAVPAHLAHGDTEGRCGEKNEEDEEEEELEIDNIQKEKTDTTTTITWDTNLLSSSHIEYATSTLATANPITILDDATLVASHLFDLTNLTPSTTYFFVVSSTDGDGNTATSSEKTFDTKEVDEAEKEFLISTSRTIDPESYTEGAETIISVTVTLTGTGDGTVLALGYQESIPEGWILDSRTDDGPFSIFNQIDNVFEYASLSIFEESDFPLSFSYDIIAAEDSIGEQEIVGKALYRLLGPELQSNTATTSIAFIEL